MKRFKNILFVFNPDIKLRTALNRAHALARSNKARLTIFTAIKKPAIELTPEDLPESMKDFEKLVLDEFKKQIKEVAKPILKQGIKVESEIRFGTPFIEIIKQVLRANHDLVILSAEGKGGIKQRLFGSTSMHLMRKCPCPVWVVKPDEDKKYHRILAAVDVGSDFLEEDETPLNELILQLASSLARQEKAEFHVVQAWSLFAESYMMTRGMVPQESINESNERLKEKYYSRLGSLLESCNFKGVKPREHLVKGEPHSVIVDLTSQLDIDLLVMGTLCRTGLPGFFIGNTAERVLAEVNCSVLTVKPTGFVSPITVTGR